MKEKLVLNVDSPLKNLIEKVESTKTSVQVFRGEKVVAKIIPAESTIREEIASKNTYKTWGESLLLSNGV